MSQPEPLPELSRSAQLMVAKLIRMVASGFAGEIRLVCGQGGIRTLTASETWTAKDVERERS